MSNKAPIDKHYVQRLLDELVPGLFRDPDSIPAELIDEVKHQAEEAAQAWDTLVREGMIVPEIDEQGNPVYRNCRPVYISSPKGLNMESGWKGRN
jgi:hypothetical protein